MKDLRPIDRYCRHRRLYQILWGAGPTDAMLDEIKHGMTSDSVEKKPHVRCANGWTEVPHKILWISDHNDKIIHEYLLIFMDEQGKQDFASLNAQKEVKLIHDLLTGKRTDFNEQLQEQTTINERTEDESTGRNSGMVS